MHFNILIIYLFIFFHSSYCDSIENSPVYGYHLKTGVPEAQRILRIESEGFSYRIVGGSEVTASTTIPHHAGIIARLTGGLVSVCGGALISATRVLTAAHCWFDGHKQARQFTIVLGSLSIFSGGTRINTLDVTMHSSWNYLLNDIAIVKIDAVKLSNTIAAISLPTTADVGQNFAGTSGQVSGYGQTSDVKITVPSTLALHQLTVPIITNAVCQKSFKVAIATSYICTGGTGGKGCCHGDSGGPLTVLHQNKRILVGLVSFGPLEGCQASAPSVYTRVTSFLPWINSHL